MILSNGGRVDIDGPAPGARAVSRADVLICQNLRHKEKVRKLTCPPVITLYSRSNLSIEYRHEFKPTDRSKYEISKSFIRS